MKTALISGGTSGIGKATVKQLLDDGFNVATFSSSKEKCEALKKEVKDKKLLVLKGDVSSEKDVESIVKETIIRFGSIDVLVNNAGFGYFIHADTVDMAKFRKMLDVNVFGMALLTKFVVPGMKKRKKGIIINIASISGRKVFPQGEFYSATKFAVIGYSEGIRMELREHGIKVCTICPGMVKTDFFTKEDYDRRMKTMWNGKEPVMLDPKDVAKLISFMCSQPAHSNIDDATIMPF
jgi:NADP-dependent 3-hydroxy acid dehydrogenase YdfG